MPENADRLLALTAQIAAAYVGENAVNAKAVPGLIRDIHRSLTGLDPSSVVIQATAQPCPRSGQPRSRRSISGNPSSPTI